MHPAGRPGGGPLDYRNSLDYHSTIPIVTEARVAKRTEPLGEGQLEVLQYVADHHPIRVADVADHFARTAGKARTTILTVMEKLREKGYLTRRKIKGTFHYSPRIVKSELLAGIVGRFVDR